MVRRLRTIHHFSYTEIWSYCSCLTLFGHCPDTVQTLPRHCLDIVWLVSQGGWVGGGWLDQLKLMLPQPNFGWAEHSNSSPLKLLPDDHLMATDCNAGCSCQFPSCSTFSYYFLVFEWLFSLSKPKVESTLCALLIIRFVLNTRGRICRQM